MRQLLHENLWLAAAVAALVAVFAAMLVHRIARAVLRRVMNKTVVIKAVLDATERAGAAALPLFALQLVWQAAPDTLRYIGSVRHLNGLLLIAALTWLLISFVNGFAEGVVQRHPATVEDNLQARRILTQARVLARTANIVLLIAGTAMALMTFPGARQVGASLLASAGVVGIVGGIAARPVFSNMIAGLQLALSQPIRIDDALIVKGEFGKVEEITGTYVVLKLWDERRMIVPLQWFIENPFENWTRTGSQLLAPVLLWLDYATPMAPLRAEAERIVEDCPEWDGRVFNVQVTDATDKCIQVRVLMSAINSGKAFDLRCKVREQLIAFLAREYPQSLPLVRNLNDNRDWQAPGAATG